MPGSGPAGAHRDRGQRGGAGGRRAQHLRAQPHGVRARGPEGEGLAVGDPALGTDHDGDRPGARDLQGGQRPAGLLVQHQRQVDVGQQPADLPGGHRLGDLGDPGTPGRLGGRPRRGPPPGQALVDAVGPPAGHAAGRGPRDDPVDAELGGEVDGERPAVALGQRLDEEELRLRRRHVVPGGDPHPQPLGTAGDDDALGDPAAAVADPHLLASVQPQHVDGVPALGAVDQQLLPPGQVVEQEQRGAVELGGLGRHPAFHASRMRENSPPWPSPRSPWGRSSPRSTASSRSSFSCSGSSLVGVTTSTWTIRLPRPVARSRGAPWPRRVSTLPDWVPGLMSSSCSPSRVSRFSVVPSAAEVIGRVTRQCRSSPSRVNTGCGRSWISTYRSPAGPPPGPTSPWPVSRIRMPSSTPAGTLTGMVRRARTRPSPAQLGHGSGMTWPVPAQVGQVREETTWPRNERCTLCTSPRPPQVVQVAGWVPGAVPAPLHAVHRTAVSTVISLVVPKTVSSRSSSTRMSASPPSRTRLRGPRVAVPPPKKASMMSPRPPNPAPNGLPAPAPPAPLSNGSPPRSTMRRFSGSVSAW